MLSSLGDEEKRPNYDNKGARLNLIRTRTLTMMRTS